MQTPLSSTTVRGLILTGISGIVQMLVIAGVLDAVEAGKSVELITHIVTSVAELVGIYMAWRGRNNPNIAPLTTSGAPPTLRGPSSGPMRVLFMAVALAATASACAPDTARFSRPLTVEEQLREERAARIKAVAAVELVWREVLTQIRQAREAGDIKQADIDKWAPAIQSIESGLEVANSLAKGGQSPDGELGDVNRLIGELRAELRRRAPTAERRT